MFQANSRNTRRRCDMFKVYNNESRAMTLFYSSVDYHNIGSQQTLNCSKSVI